MKRWLPYPLLWAALLALWLLLNQTLAAGHLLLGAALAFGGGLAFAGLQAPAGRLRRAGAVPALLWLVFEDIVRSRARRTACSPSIRSTSTPCCWC